MNIQTGSTALRSDTLRYSCKRMLAVLLAIAMVFSLAACAKSGSSGTESIGGSSDSSGVKLDGSKYYNFSHDKSGLLVAPAETLSAEEIYRSVTYTPQMFYGRYELDAGKEERNKVCSALGYMTVTLVNGERTITTIPHCICAGYDTLSHVLNRVCPEHNWAELLFLSDQNDLVSTKGAYEVKGTSYYFWPLTSYQYDENTGEVAYTLSDTPLVYDFSFCGPDLTLSANGKSLTIRAYGFVSENAFGSHNVRAYVENYLTSGSPCLDGIQQINLLSEDGKTKNERFYLVMENKERVHNTVGTLAEDGLVTFSWTDADGKQHSHQLVFFWCYNDGAVLTDGKTTYYYNDSYSTHYNNLLGDNLTEEDKELLENMGENKLEELAEKRSNLFDELAAAFQAANLNVTVDKESGEIMLDSAVLFGLDQSELSEDGKQFLKQFLAVYADVVLGTEYDGFVSKIMVEGHTDPQGSYEYNLELSQARADAVKAWCLDAENGLDAETISVLEGLLEAVGYSFDHPVYDENGQVDNDASRRVSFRFLIQLG